MNWKHKAVLTFLFLGFVELTFAALPEEEPMNFGNNLNSYSYGDETNEKYQPGFSAVSERDTSAQYTTYSPPTIKEPTFAPDTIEVTAKVKPLPEIKTAALTPAKIEAIAPRIQKNNLSETMIPASFGLQSTKSLMGHYCSSNDQPFQCQVCNCVFEASKDPKDELEREAVVTTVFNRMQIPLYPKTACGNVWYRNRRGGRAYSWTNPKIWQKMGQKYRPVLGTNARHRGHVARCAKAVRKVAAQYYSYQPMACYTNYYSPAGMKAYRRRGVRIRSLIPSFAKGRKYSQLGPHRFTCNHGSSESIARNSETRTYHPQMAQLYTKRTIQ